MKSRKIIPIVVSFFITLISGCILIFLLRIYNSHKVFKVFEFSEPVTYHDGIIDAQDSAYVYNEYGGKITKSELSSMPLSQYSQLDEEYLFYIVNSIDLLQIFKSGQNQLHIF